MLPEQSNERRPPLLDFRSPFFFFCSIQPLASTLPDRLSASDRPQTRLTDLEPPVVTRQLAASDLLAKYTRPEAHESGSDSDREPEDDELAQNSDSAVGKRLALVIQLKNHCVNFVVYVLVLERTH